MPREWTTTAYDRALLVPFQYQWICGMDEVGRGCVAGPMCIAAILVTPDTIDNLENCVRDSKQMTENARRHIAHALRQLPHAYFLKTAQEIDSNGINPCNVQAFQEGAQWARSTGHGKGRILVDGNLKGDDLECLVKGEDLSTAIAAASILAKTYRDQLMETLAQDHPEYGFEKHKGYGTPNHLAMIRKNGLVEGIHRLSFLTRL